MFNETITFPASFLAGILSFFSPCVLPLIPAYFTSITGFSIEELEDAENRGIRTRVILSTLSYVLGFTFLFVSLGASASIVGGVAAKYSEYIRIAGGLIIIALGIHLSGIIRIRGLEFEKRINMKGKPLHFFGTFLVGMAFGAGWSPCIGPLLGSVLIVAGTAETVFKGASLLVVYSAGLAMPFILISIFIHYMLSFIKRANKVLRYVNTISGILLICIGALLVLNKLSYLSVTY
jgi:cytochrome c-type biogenesis protein